MDRRPLALILGGARCVWDDLLEAELLADFEAVFAINDMIPAYEGRIDYAVSLHPEKMDAWIKARALNKAPMDFQTVAHATCIDHTTRFKPDIEVNHKTDRVMSLGGSSGLFAAIVAIRFGYRAILCGVPMDHQPHFFDTKTWDALNGFWPEWKRMQPYIAPHIRSMSGSTKDLLGEPTPAWIAG